MSTIGLDIAKSVFQMHGVDAAGQVALRRQSKRRNVLAFFQKLPPCLVGIEACASSHHWSLRQSVASTEGSDTGVRQAHHRLASVKRDQQAAGRDPWRRSGEPCTSCQARRTDSWHFPGDEVRFLPAGERPRALRT